jgi:hypothetical protein
MRKISSPTGILLERDMSAWTEKELEVIKRHYIGPDKDFAALVKCLSATWTKADLERLERSGQSLAWDEYFQCEKLLSYRAGDAD